MIEQKDPKKKKAVAVEAPIHTIRVGAVGASIWRRQSPAGYVYFDFSLSRSWKSLSSGNTGHSKNFFASNQQDLVRIIEQAARWISEHEQKLAGVESIAA